MSKEEIILELKNILKLADGYDIDPYILYELLNKIENKDK